MGGQCVLTMIMKIIVWNCLGVAGKGFAASMRNLCKEFRPDLVVLLEPRVSGVKGRRIIKSLGFGFSVVEEARGFAGGIWVLWKEEGLDLRVVEKEEQYIHCCLNSVREDEWFFTAVYACPQEEGREELWLNMNRLSEQMEGKWFIAGDFNEIADPSEQKGGAQVNVDKCNNFKRRIDEWNLMDVDLKGQKFTWKGLKWRGYERLFKQLDICLYNVQ